MHIKMKILYSSFLGPSPQTFLNACSSSAINSKPIIASTYSSNLNTYHRQIKKLITSKVDQSLKNSPFPFSNHSLLATVLNSLDDFICNFIDSPGLRPTIDPKHVLSGNFAPVDELPPTACAMVEGVLPSCLNGAYIRNGPNPQFIPNGPYHLFEGDGMLHMIRISQGRATFCSRYVSTHKHSVELKNGYPFVPSIFSSFDGGLTATVARLAVTAARILSGQFNPLMHGFGAANTSLAVFAGHIFALCESDLPYAVKVTPEGDIVTLGRQDFGATEKFSRMTAHPKVDSVTGEAFAYRYNISRPFLTLFRIDSDGRKQKDVHISSMGGLTAMHDFAVTENYCIIPDIQIVVKPSWILRGRSPVETDPNKVARVGIIPRYAEDEKEMVWIDAPGFNALHCVNAWEEDGGDTIVVVASNALAVDQLMESIDFAELTMEKITIDVKGKRVHRQPLSHRFLELGVINPAYAAKKNRYVYAVIIGPNMRTLGLAKLDLPLSNKEVSSDCTVASRLYLPGCHGGEPFFVAREPNNPAAAEDDGYLVTYVHDENAGESKFLVMDAKSPTLQTVAAVKLPQRIPNGFHGLFVSENDLKNLRC